MVNSEFRRLLGAERCAQAWRSLGANIDRSASLSAGVTIRKPANVTIGPGCRLAGEVLLESWDQITLASNVMVNSAKLYTGGHDPNSPSLAGTSGPIFIGDHAWIINDVIVLPGVTIGDGAVVATGSVVTRDVDQYTVVAGNPARWIKDRERQTYSYVPSSNNWEL